MFIQTKTVKMLRGDILGIEFSDPMEVEFMEALETLRENVRDAEVGDFETLETTDGIIRVYATGYVEIFAVRGIPS